MFTIQLNTEPWFPHNRLRDGEPGKTKGSEPASLGPSGQTFKSHAAKMKLPIDTQKPPGPLKDEANILNQINPN